MHCSFTPQRSRWKYFQFYSKSAQLIINVYLKVILKIFSWPITRDLISQETGMFLIMPNFRNWILDICWMFCSNFILRHSFSCGSTQSFASIGQRQVVPLYSCVFQRVWSKPGSIQRLFVSISNFNGLYFDWTIKCSVSIVVKFLCSCICPD